MFQWLRRWFQQDEKYDLYYPKERRIYAYFDGRQMRHADPIVLYRRMADIGPELNVDLNVATSPSKDAGHAQKELVVKICSIFDVKPFGSEGGLTEVELLDLLNHFMTYVGMVKKNGPTPPMSSASSPVSPSTYSAPTASITPSSAACGSTPPAATTVPPGPLPVEPVSPSEPSILDPISTAT